MRHTNSDLKTLQLQYHGFIQTPNLWLANTVFGLNQFVYTPNPNIQFTDSYNIPIRLGKRVEHFVCQDFNSNSDIQLLAHNLQIQRNKQTIGELDALIKHQEQYIHLEIVYKFYLYDPAVGSNELDHYIGPNRKDSLNYKLEKLKTKQLALLFRPEIKPYLDQLGLKVSDIQQQILFKAQLFMPYGKSLPDLQVLNPDGIAGYYIKRESLPSLSHCLFYIPSKLNWLIAVQPDVSWLSYNRFLEALSVFLDHRQAPLIWMKHPDGNMERCFVVWW